MVVLGLGILAYWLLVFRWHLVQGDDFTNAARAEHPGGAMSPAEWWSAYAYDYTQMNGRLADSIVRLVMLPGHWFWQLAGPLLFATVTVQLLHCGLAGARAAGRRAPWWVFAVLAVAAASVIPLLVREVPTITGDALFWTSATVTYVLPAALVLTVTAAVGAAAARAPGGVPVRPARLAWVTAVIVLAELVQEESAVAVLLVVAVAALLGGRRARLPWPWVAATAVGFAVKVAAPGIRVRAGTMGDSGAPLGPDELVRRAANAAQVVATTATPALAGAAVLGGLLAVLALRGHPAARAVSHRAAAWALAAAIVAALATAALAAIAWHRTQIGMPVLDVAALRIGGLRPVALGAVGAGALAAAALATLAVALRPLLGPAPVLLVVAAAGSLAAPAGIGVVTPRGYVVAYLVLCALALHLAGAMLAAATRRPDESAPEAAARRAEPGRVLARVGAAAVAAATLVAAIVAAPAVLRMPRDMRDNHAIWAGVERQLDAIRAGRCSRITVPTGFPHPTYITANGFSEWYEPAMNLYYDVPAGTVWQRQGRGDCP